MTVSSGAKGAEELGEVKVLSEKKHTHTRTGVTPHAADCNREHTQLIIGACGRSRRVVLKPLQSDPYAADDLVPSDPERHEDHHDAEQLSVLAVEQHDLPPEPGGAACRY